MATLLVASGGGHLKELHRIATRLGSDPGATTWVSFDIPQVRSLLAAENVEYANYTAPRDLRAVMSNTPLARALLSGGGYDTLVSTGAQLALPFFAVAAAHGVRGHFIESAARTGRPSMTGRLVSRLPGVRAYHQYPGGTGSHWGYGGSVFDGFTPIVRPVHSAQISKAVVVLGTMPAYRFDRLVERLQQLLGPSVEVLWQTGATDVSHLGIDGRPWVPHAELFAAMREADLVVAHAGVGTALDALESGHVPVLVPRRAQYREHVDDHQLQIAAHLKERGLAVTASAEELSLDHLVQAVGMRAEQPFELPPFQLRTAA